METLREPAAESRPEAPEAVASNQFDLSWFTTERIQRSVEIVVVVIAVGFVLGQLGLGNILKDTTPAGGDMGAHVWGPAYLRDHLLPSGTLSGWTPDWYDGFPAYQFYMVVPALMVVILNAGFHGWAALLPIAAVAAIAVYAIRQPHRSTRQRAAVAAAVVVGIPFIGLPYGVAFKVVTVLGLLTLPIALYAFARLAELPFPAPPLFALGTLPFLFNREPSGGNGNIIGGNMTSTLAGEFSFSLSLTFGVLFLGVMVNGMRTGRYRWLAAILLALTALCHVIVGIFAVIAAVAAFVVWPGIARLKWFAAALPVGGLLSAFWTFPFLARHQYVNDMGWAKLPVGTGSRSATHLLADFWSNAAIPGLPVKPGQSNGLRDVVIGTYLNPTSLHWIFTLALIGLVVSAVLRIRVGIWLGIVTFSMAVAFLIAPESRLWNARLLPFYYLGLVLLAALAVAELSRAVALLVASDADRPSVAVNVSAVGISVLAVIIVVGLPLKLLPGTKVENGEFRWLMVSTGADLDPSPYWAQWNYKGYEDIKSKPFYPEYYDLVTTMERVGADNGCGRAMWEYDNNRLDKYGTPMSPMLLALWTDGCIGSMEGLYFESSTTTPFHFINQKELSANCSCAQRNLPYGKFDISLGVKHLQLLGVRYYLADTQKAIDAADQEPALSEIAVSGPWHVYEIADSPLVEPLENEPAVVTTHNGGLEWTYGTSDPHTAPTDADGKTIYANGPAMTWYTDPTRWNVFLAADGPASWARVEDGETPPARPVDTPEVRNVTTSRDTVDFDVDRIGTPILVKMSYFPNWKVDGAEGPYRVTPNLMVVIPTSKHVHLHYGRTSVEWIAYALTLVGIALVIFLARRPALAMPLSPSDDDHLARMLESPKHPAPTDRYYVIEEDTSPPG